MTNEQKLAANKGVFTYHACLHSQSLNCMDCTSQLVRKLYEKKFTCGRTRTKSIITNVFLPYTINVLKKDLSVCNFISIMTDTSNHISQKKIVPILIPYFHPNKGIKNNILEFNELSGKTALLLTDYILSKLHEWKIENKII